MGRSRTEKLKNSKKYATCNSTGSAVHLLVSPIQALCSNPRHQTKGHHVPLGWCGRQGSSPAMGGVPSDCFGLFYSRCKSSFAMAIPMVRWLEIRRVTTTKRGSQNKPLVRHPARGLNLGDHTNQEAHDVPWFGARDLNTVPRLATLGGAPLRQCCCTSRNFVSFLANTRFSVRDRLAGYLLRPLLCFF